MHLGTLLAFFYIVFCLSFAWGYIAADQKIFPHLFLSSITSQYTSFAEGHEDEQETSSFQKIISDFGGVPHRYISKNPQQPVFNRPAFYNKEKRPNEGTFFSVANSSKLDGYMLLSGVFNHEKQSKFAVKLVDMEGKTHRTWYLPGRQDLAATIDERNGNLFVVGFPSPKSKIYAYNWCGNKRAKFFSRAHHSVEIAPDGTLWTLQHGKVVQLDIEAIFKNASFGKLIQSFSLDEIAEKNESLGILDQRFNYDFNKKSDPEKKKALRKPMGRVNDYYHHNDAQPFIDPRFPTKLGYALLVSVRNLNLVMVLDPTTHKVLWWSQGNMQMQHDPDYFKGAVYVYDNRPFREWSQIARLDFDKPATLEKQIAVDGKNFAWHEVYRGNHSVFEDNGKTYHLIVDDRDGRVIITDENQQMHLELFNHITDTATMYIFNALWVSKEDYARFERKCAS